MTHKLKSLIDKLIIVSVRSQLMVKQTKQVIATKERSLVFFDIDQTRKEMAHSINESVAVSILALVLFIGAPSVFPEIINPYLPSSLKIMQAIVATPFIFWLITVMSNMVRYFRILKLQDMLTKWFYVLCVHQ